MKLFVVQISSSVKLLVHHHKTNKQTDKQKPNWNEEKKKKKEIGLGWQQMTGAKYFNLESLYRKQFSQAARHCVNDTEAAMKPNERKKSQVWGDQTAFLNKDSKLHEEVKSKYIRVNSTAQVPFSCSA